MTQPTNQMKAAKLAADMLNRFGLSAYHKEGFRCGKTFCNGVYSITFEARGVEVLGNGKVLFSDFHSSILLSYRNACQAILDDYEAYKAAN